MGRLGAVALAAALFAPPALAQIISGGSPTDGGVPISAAQMAASISTASSFLGQYTVATIPACSTTNYGKLAYVSDLGGGANNVKCVTGYWEHLTDGVPAINATTTNATITPLASAPIQIFSATGLSVAQTITVSTTNLYPGYKLTIRKPGVISLGGSLGVMLAGTGTTLPVLGSSTSIFVYDGTALQQIQ